MPLRILSALLLLCMNLPGSVPPPADADRDGLPDDFEQAILTRFLPTFHISESDCDVAPAEFEASTREPKAKAKNGTIYGQVMPVLRANDRAGWIEVHYFHLWAQDCGHSPHPLDVESVAVLLRGERGKFRADAWQATHWYAAAHEGTLCDMSNGATASALNATERGPDVWVSQDKHASFLDRELCLRGCGKDRCDLTRPLAVSRIVNLGEPGAPLGGSDWVTSSSWPLASKMQPDFTDSLVARIPQGDSVQTLPSRDVARGMRTTIKVAANTYSSLETANTNTGAAIGSGVDGAATGVNAAGSAVAVSAKHTKRSLKTALSSTATSVSKAFRWRSRKPAEPR